MPQEHTHPNQYLAATYWALPRDHLSPMKQWEKKRQGGRVSNSPLRASQHSEHFKGSEKYQNSNAYLTQPSPNPLVTLPLHSKAINTYTR